MIARRWITLEEMVWTENLSRFCIEQITSNLGGADEAIIGNLFNVLHKPPHVLPDEVHPRTLARLKEVVSKHLDLPAEIVDETYTVRKVVEEICKFNSSSTLCWDILGRISRVEGTSNPLRQGQRQNHALRRVFALCAEPVANKVNQVLKQHPELVLLDLMSGDAGGSEGATA